MTRRKARVSYNKIENIDGTLDRLFVTLYWVRVRDRGSLGLGVRVRVLELSSVSSIALFVTQACSHGESPLGAVN